MIRAHKALVLVAVSVAVMVLAGAVFAASGSNQPPKSSNQQGVTNRAETPRNPVISGEFKYPDTRTGWYTLSPSDFTPDHVITEYFTNWTGDELTSTDTTACFNAGIHLPQGAKITWIDFYYRSGAAGDFYGELVRQEVATSTAESLGFVNPVDDSDVPTSSSVNIVPGLQKVKNAIYAYMVGVCPNDSGAFHGARVEYTYKKAGD